MSEHAEQHSSSNYVKIWAALVVLLAISVAGPMFGIKVVTLITAFGVALVKAFLVARSFMHVHFEPKFVPYLLIAALAIMSLMFFLVAPDVMEHAGRNWVNVAAHNTGKVSSTAVEANQAPFDAKEAFQTVCSLCHGTLGDGQGPAGKALNPHPANFTDPAFWKVHTRTQVIKVIRDGGASVGKSPLMAPFGATYNAEQIEELADVVISFGPGAKPE